MRARARHVLSWLVLALVGCTAAAIGYTVQVAALSDADSALEVSRTLLRDGFPAYVVRAEGGAGSVFRVRVGAFGDRVVAERYAAQMGERAGGQPQPALAEAIPAGILPLQPQRILSVPEGDAVALLPWGDTVALREHRGEGSPARYHVPGAEAVTAWWAAPAAGGRVAVEAMPLVSGQAAADPEEVQEAVVAQRLRLLAEQTGSPLENLQEAVRRDPEFGGPHLVVMRRVHRDGEREVLSVAMADADPRSRRPEDWWGSPPPEAEEPLWTPAEEVPEQVVGQGWSATHDGVFTRVEAGVATWRALVGVPLWGREDLLLVRVDEAYELVRFDPR